MTTATPSATDAASAHAAEPVADAAPRLRRAAFDGMTPPRVAGSLSRSAPWALLLVLMLLAQALLLALTVRYERVRMNTRVATLAAAAATRFQNRAQADLLALAPTTNATLDKERWREVAAPLLQPRPHLLRIELRDIQYRRITAVHSALGVRTLRDIDSEGPHEGTRATCDAAGLHGRARFAPTYEVPTGDGTHVEVIDLCMASQRDGRTEGYVVAVFSLPAMLSRAADPASQERAELSLLSTHGELLATAGGLPGAGVYVADHTLVLPGTVMQLRADSRNGNLFLAPSQSMLLAIGLSLAMLSVVTLLVRDARRRASDQAALGDALAFRHAMEDALVAGLIATDLQGRVTYVNAALCEMVGLAPQDVVGRDPPPYWPAELVAEYRERHRAGVPAQRDSDGFETSFMRAGGERFSVRILEAPLVNGSGQHIGWMSTVLDINRQQQVEEEARQQREKLQTSARLATVGEMASLLGHELNQPLAAISSFATGTLNLLEGDEVDRETLQLVRRGVQRIADHAGLAGRVVKSVHNFVRRREHARQPVVAAALIEEVLPLVDLRARRSQVRVAVELPPQSPEVLCDPTMIEQVLMNLARNGIQAMEEASTPAAGRILTLALRCTDEHTVTFAVTDRGPGIPPDVQERLFTPFFTTRAEGLGLGLSMCRTVVEQHGGTLAFARVDIGGAPATEFTLQLPVRPRPGASRRSAPIPLPEEGTSA